MKNYKKFGIGLFTALVLSVSALAILPASRALAAAQPFSNNKIFSGVTYTLNKNGTITTTLVDNTTNGSSNYPLVFTDSTPNNSSHVYTSDKTYFCYSQTDFRDNVAATITLSGKPSGKTISGQLSAYVLPAGGSACTDNSGTISITNANPGTGGSGGLPSTLSYNGNTYNIIDPAYPLYGLNGVKGSDCYGGSVISTNSAGTKGTAYLGLVGTSGVTELQTSLIKSGVTDSHILSLIQGCYFDSSANISGYSGSISNGTLNAPPPVTQSTPDTSSSCVDDISLAWILCPVINGLSKSADGINGFVEGQLNFSVQDNLSVSVHKAWTIFRTLTSVIIVIVMLVMVFSQAIGGGPFDAYTVRKLLPKLVAAIILMQISWPLCEYAIRLSNDAGQSIGQLMAAPFGGPNALELGSLLQRWNGAGAVATGVATTTGLIGAIFAGGFLITLGWPILLLAILLVFITLVVAFATLLVRNALIVLLVMAAPLAFIAFVMPGADRYWKMWKDNFLRVLVFFPLVIGLIYAGRIFAWIVAGLGSPGPLDLIMVLAGFFGPYFFLPKTFKWAGPGVAAAANAIGNSFPVKKGREVAGRELLARQREKQKQLVDSKYSSLVWGKNGKEGKDADMGSRVRAGFRRGWVRTAAGYPIATKRQTMRMLQEAGKWKEEEVALQKAKISNDYKEFQKHFGNVPDAKRAIRDKYYSDGKNPLGDRSFFTWAHDTKSFMEMGDKDWRTGGGKYRDMFKTQGWIDFMHGNDGAYSDFSSRLGASSVPYRLPLGGGPKMQDYLPGGKRYNLLDFQDAVETNDAGKIRVKKNGQPIYKLDADGNRMPNPYHNPRLKEIIDADPNSEATVHLAELTADSERFTKLISQSDDPSAVAAQRPEEFEALANITKELRQSGANSPGQISLKAFIDQQAKAFAGRNVLQRLTLSAAGPIDDMMKEANYVQSRLTPTSGAAEAGEAVQTGVSQGGGGGSQSGGGTGGSREPRPSGPPGGGFSPGGRATSPGNVVFSAPGTSYAAPPQPVELKIDHDALANTIIEASRKGTKQGFNQAMKDVGHQPGDVFRPGGGSGSDEDDEKNT